MPGEQRLPGLDLLRAFAIVWVMLYHLESYGFAMPRIVQYGHMGVDLFFALSGYLIGWQLLKPYTHGEQPEWRQFFLRRALRLLPAYLVVLALYFFVPAWRESQGMQPLWQFLTFTQNLFPDYFHNRAFSHAWSLCVEEHFYLLLPAVVWLVARQPTPARVAAIVIATLLGGMALRAWLWQQEVAPFRHIVTGEGSFLIRYIERIYNPTYTRLDGLLAGVVLALVKDFRPDWWSWAMARAPWFLVLGALGVAGAMSLDSPGYASAVFGFPLLSFGLACVVLAAISPGTWLGRVAIPGAKPLATMAFSLYLTHKAVFHWLEANAGMRGDWIGLGTYLGAAFAMGAVLYLCVERPGLRLRARLGKPQQHSAGREENA